MGYGQECARPGELYDYPGNPLRTASACRSSPDAPHDRGRGRALVPGLGTAEPDCEGPVRRRSIICGESPNLSPVLTRSPRVSSHGKIWLEDTSRGAYTRFILPQRRLAAMPVARRRHHGDGGGRACPCSRRKPGTAGCLPTVPISLTRGNARLPPNPTSRCGPPPPRRLRLAGRVDEPAEQLRGREGSEPRRLSWSSRAHPNRRPAGRR